MKRCPCLPCKIPHFYVLSGKGEGRLVFVTEDFQIVPAKSGETTEGFDLALLYCPECSWRGSTQRTVRY